MINKAIILYHPDNALTALVYAEECGMSDYAFPSRYMPVGEIWITQDPDVIAAYERVIDCQRDFTEKVFDK